MGECLQTISCYCTCSVIPCVTCGAFTHAACTEIETRAERYQKHNLHYLFPKSQLPVLPEPTNLSRDPRRSLLRAPLFSSFSALPLSPEAREWVCSCAADYSHCRYSCAAQVMAFSISVTISFGLCKRLGHSCCRRRRASMALLDLGQGKPG